MARYGWEHDRPGRHGHGRYGREYGGGGWMGPLPGTPYTGMAAVPGMGYPWGGPVAGYGSMAGGSGYGGDYDRNYKSNWQTERGDPYGDRERGTPLRTTRGPFHARDGGYDRGDYRRRVEYGYRGHDGYHDGGFRGEDRYRGGDAYRGNDEYHGNDAYRADDGYPGPRGYDRGRW